MIMIPLLFLAGAFFNIGLTIGTHDPGFLIATGIYLLGIVGWAIIKSDKETTMTTRRCQRPHWRHVWGKWEMNWSGSIIQHRICERCGFRQEKFL